MIGGESNWNTKTDALVFCRDDPDEVVKIDDVVDNPSSTSAIKLTGFSAAFR